MAAGTDLSLVSVLPPLPYDVGVLIVVLFVTRGGREVGGGLKAIIRSTSFSLAPSPAASCRVGIGEASAGIMLDEGALTICV